MCGVVCLLSQVLVTRPTTARSGTRDRVLHPGLGGSTVLARTCQDETNYSISPLPSSMCFLAMVYQTHPFISNFSFYCMIYNLLVIVPLFFLQQQLPVPFAQK